MQEIQDVEADNSVYFPTAHTLQNEEPLVVEENRPAGHFVHCVAPENIVCVEVKSVLTSAAKSTLLYILKSLMPPFK